MNTNNIKISIIIVNFNGKKFLLECLKSIKKSTYKNYEIIIVDNASTDNSIKLSKKIKILNTKYLILNTNVGFSTANNQAVRISTGDYLFFLNNDTKINPQTLNNLISSINKKTEIGTCKIMSYDGKVLFHNGIGIDIFGFPINKGKTFYGEGSALLFKKSIFFKLGQFDSSYFMFHEDVDLCWRAWLFGYRVKTIPNAVVYHFAGGSAGGGYPGKNKYKSSLLRRYYSERNNLTTLIKNYSFFLLILILPLYFFINILEILIFTLSFQPKIGFYYIKAYVWNLVNIKSILSKRLFIQKNRTISDYEILINMYFGIGKLLSFLKVGIPNYK